MGGLIFGWPRPVWYWVKLGDKVGDRGQLLITGLTGDKAPIEFIPPISSLYHLPKRRRYFSNIFDIYGQLERQSRSCYLNKKIADII